MEMDWEELDGPSNAPEKTVMKLSPKKSKDKGVAEAKREPEAPVPSSESDPAAVEDPSVSEKMNVDEEPSDENVRAKIDRADTDKKQDEGDGVVREIDVFVNASADDASKLYVLQFPLRPHWRPYDLENKCEMVKLKPETDEVEIELSIDHDSSNFDAAGTSTPFPKQVLSTTWKPPKASGYAVGVLKGNELYLNPVDAVVQLRPSMRHLNKQSNNIEGSSNQEEWIPLNYHGKDSEESFRCMEKMMAAREGSEIQFTMSRSDYLDSLCGITRPNIFSVVTTAASLPREDPWEVPREVGYEIMRRLPLEDLGKFKTVSKSWKWHISNPEFIRILLQNNKNRKLILASRPKYNSKPTALFSLGVNESKAKAMFKKPKTKLDVVGTCIGLILAQDCIDKDLLHLMNPVMQQMYRVPFATIAPDIAVRGRGMSYVYVWVWA